MGPLRRRALPPAEVMEDLPGGALGGRRGDALDERRGRRPAAQEAGARREAAEGLGQDLKP